MANKIKQNISNGLKLKKISHGLKELKIISLFFVLLFLTSCNSNILKDDSIELDIGGYIVNVEIVSDFSNKAKGLSGRDNLCEDCGMLFIYNNKAKYSFWMKNMNFPLDIIYINHDEIVEIFKNVQAFSNNDEFTEIFPNYEADKVLELNAGWCDLHNVEIGDRIIIE